MKIWIIQIVNYTLSFLMWMIMGRLILNLLIGNRRNIMVSAFEKLTDPIFRMTKRIVPFAKESFIPFWSILFIFLLRLVIIIATRPSTQP